MSGSEKGMDDDEPTLAAASDVVAKIREQAAALRRGSTSPAAQSLTPTDSADASSQWMVDVPALIEMPAPVARTATGNNSGR